MANNTGSIVFIEDNGTIILPVTHERGVVDSNGVDLETKLASIGGAGVEEITWTNLKQKRDSGQLDAGKNYRITDYVAVVNHSECRSANHPFDLIVTAISSNELSEQCRAIQHQGDTYFSNCNLSAWKVEYCLDNDTIRFDWADSINGKGVIYHLVDEWNNDVPYDFKGIQFKRYKVSVDSGYNDYLGTLTGQYVGVATDPSGRSVQGLVNNTSDYKWYYTFSWINDNVLEDYSIKDFNGCVENTIDMYFHGESNFVTSRNINNTVFAAGEDIRDILEVVLGAAYEREEGFDSIASNKIGQISGYNTVFGSFNRIYTNAQFRGCIIIGAFYENTIGSYFQDNKIISPIARYSTYTNSFCHNIINSEEISGNTIGEHCDNNKIKCQLFDRNNLGSRFINNVVNSSEYFTDNEFHSNIRDNEFNHAVSHNNFLGGQVTNCVFNNIILNCTFSGMCQYLTIDSGTPTDRLMTTDVKYISGTEANRIEITDSRLFWTSANRRHIVIERDPDGDIIATWKDNGQEVGIMYDLTQQTWVSIADETTSNKVTTITAASTDTQYPSARAVYESIPISAYERVVHDVYNPDAQDLDGLYDDCETDLSHGKIPYLVLTDQVPGDYPVVWYLAADRAADDGEIMFKDSLNNYLLTLYSDGSVGITEYREFERTTNKTSYITSSSTTVEYPNAKGVYDTMMKWMSRATGKDMEDIVGQYTYLTFEAKNNNTQILFKTSHADYALTIYASVNGGAWNGVTATTSGATVCTLNKGQKVRIKGAHRSYANSTKNCSFVFQNECYVYGNIMSLVHDSGFETKTKLLEDYTFAHLFDFQFNPILSHPVNKLVLPATTLTTGCYAGMFKGCTFIETAPTLPAETLTTSAYFNMFNGCFELSSITCFATDISAQDCTTGWVNGVSASGTFMKSESMSSWTSGNNGTPSGWTVENYHVE